MTDRPIIFSAPMIRALMEGRKTQTRRILNPQPVPCLCWSDPPRGTYPSAAGLSRFPYATGDRLWVRETWSGEYVFRDTPPSQRLSFVGEGQPYLHDKIWYWADGSPEFGDWEKPRPSIHMPRWASRLTLTVTDVRVQRLQDISDEDVEAEGATSLLGIGLRLDWSVDWSEIGAPSNVTGRPLTLSDIRLGSARRAFANYWNKVHGPNAWRANPWVSAISFDVHQCNIDDLLTVKPDITDDKKMGAQK